MGTCEVCNSTITKDAGYCPYCGSDQNKNQTEPDTSIDERAVHLLFYPPVITILFAYILAFLGDSVERFSAALLSLPFGILFVLRARNLKNGLALNRIFHLDRENIAEEGLADEVTRFALTYKSRSYLLGILSIAVLITLYWFFIDLPLGRLPTLITIAEHIPQLRDTAVVTQISDFLDLVSMLSTILLNSVILGWIFYILFVPTVCILDELV